MSSVNTDILLFFPPFILFYKMSMYTYIYNKLTLFTEKIIISPNTFSFQRTHWIFPKPPKNKEI